MTAAPLYQPDQLIRDAAKHGELVVFVGAGASMLCGSPDWRGFAHAVVSELETNRVLSFLEAEQLRAIGDSRRTLSVAMAIAKKEGIDIAFDRILHPPKPSTRGLELYDLISSFRPVFVTTNYDKWLDQAGPEELSTEIEPDDEAKPARRSAGRPMYYLREHLSSALLAERGAVIHLHGSYIDPNSMVVSLKDYIEHYADPRVQAFLSAMFKNYTVLFVGYGLAELEVLDYIIRSNEPLRSGTTEPRHFLLYAYRSTESVQTKFMEHFFRDQCGVRVLPYRIDDNGYGELVDVFKGWSSHLDVRAPSILDLQARLDECISSPSNPVSRDAALRLVTNHPELTSYFVNALRDPVWFSDLDDAGYFDTAHSPGVTRVESDGTVAYHAEGWPALRYLEEVAGLEDGGQAIRIAEIVRTISQDAQQRGLDNWRTQWSLATILSQLPLNVIGDQDIEMVRYWLRGRFDGNMIGQELGKNLLPRLLDSSDPAHWQRALLLVDVLSMMRRTEEPS